MMMMMMMIGTGHFFRDCISVAQGHPLQPAVSHCVSVRKTNPCAPNVGIFAGNLAFVISHVHFTVGRPRLKCDGTRAGTRFSSFGETDESI
jgi:hypothetical protein